MHDPPTPDRACSRSCASSACRSRSTTSGPATRAFAYLKRFPVHRLKIDQSFVADVPRNADDAHIVRTIIALGHNLGLRVIAEGVETEAQLRFLRRNGCDEMQGFHFGAPMPAAEFGQVLTKLDANP